MKTPLTHWWNTLKAGLVWLCLVLGSSMVSGIAPVSAQITYTVFPANEGSANGVQPTKYGIGALVTLTVQDSTIEYVVNELARQALLQPSYPTSPMLAKRVSVHLVQVNVMEAFATVLRGTGLVAMLAPNGETVVIRAHPGSLSSGRLQRAGGVVVGQVTDSASGQGLGGADVRVEGLKSFSTVTSDSGHFTLKNVPPGDQVLTVRLFGYRSATRTVTVVDSGRTPVRIVMTTVPTVLSGVVTTATGLQRKVEVGNDITTLNVDSIQQVAPVMSVTDLLATRVPGLTVLPSSGVPGNPSRLRLRGAGSVQLNNDPIIIIDGVRVYGSQSDPRNDNLAPAQSGGNFQNNNVNGGPSSPPNYAAPSPLDQIDPNSIESIELLKGPSATAIYGSDAASGVVVITTKHGRTGPTHWDLALGSGVNWLPGSWPDNFFRFGSDGTGISEQPMGLCLWSDVSCTVDSIVAFQALNMPQYTVFSHGSDQTASLTVSGGLPTVTYSLSATGAGQGGYLKLRGSEQELYNLNYGSIPGNLVRPDNYQTWGVNGQLTAQPHPNLRVTLTSSLFNSTQQQGSLQQGVAQLEGSYVDPSLLLSTPLIQNEEEVATDHQLTLTNAVTLFWQQASWFPLTGTGGINTIQRTDQTYIPFGVNSAGPNGYSGDTTGYFGLGRGSSQDNTLTVGTAIPLFRSHMTLALGGNVYDESTNDFSTYTDQLAPGVSVPTSFITTQNGRVINAPLSQTTGGSSTYGWYVEPRLNFASRFFVAPGFRLDGGSGGSHASYSGAGVTTGGIGGLSAFPKVDFSYVAVDRQGGRPLWGVLTLLRPRVAFGLAGTQPGPEDKLRLFNVGNYRLTSPGSSTNPLTNRSGGCQSTLTLDGATVVDAVCLNSLGNTQLRPERSSELEGGFDATLFQGRISVTYTQYNKTRHDAILQIPVAPSVVSLGGMGNTQIEKNIGEIRNTGTEITANVFVLQSRVLSWNVGANLSNDNSLVVSLNPGQPPICFGQGTPCQGTRIVAGYPLFSEWAQPIVSFADANHDGVIEPNEIRLGDSAVYIGQPNPKYQFNLTSDVSLLNGRLSVHVTLAYQNGLTQNNQGALSSGGFLLLPNAPTSTLATQAAIVAAGCFNGVFQGCTATAQSSFGLIQTVNTFRFQDLSINYVVPTGVARWFRVPRMTVAIQGSNLGLHTNYRGLDPDVNAFSTVSAGDETADLGQIPEPRTWWLKLTVGN